MNAKMFILLNVQNYMKANFFYLFICVESLECDVVLLFNCIAFNEYLDVHFFRYAEPYERETV